MGKNKKKRNKQYTGVDAAIVKPVVTKITAANRSAIGQWWFERKKIIKPILRVVLIVIVAIIIIVEIVRIVTGGGF